MCFFRRSPEHLSSNPTKLNVLSSVHNTWSQKSEGVSRYFRAYSTRLIQFALSMYSSLRAMQPLNPTLWNMRRTFSPKMIISNADSISASTDDPNFRQSTFAFRCIALSKLHNRLSSTTSTDYILNAFCFSLLWNYMMSWNSKYNHFPSYFVFRITI